MSANPQVTNTRQFTIITAPSLSDPAWSVVATELTNDGRTIITYNDFSAIKSVIADCERKQIEDATFSKALDQILSTLGLSFEQWLAAKQK